MAVTYLVQGRHGLGKRQADLIKIFRAVIDPVGRYLGNCRRSHRDRSLFQVWMVHADVHGGRKLELGQGDR